MIIIIIVSCVLVMWIQPRIALLLDKILAPVDMPVGPYIPNSYPIRDDSDIYRHLAVPNGQQNPPKPQPRQQPQPQQQPQPLPRMRNTAQVFKDRFPSLTVIEKRPFSEFEKEIDLSSKKTSIVIIHRDGCPFSEGGLYHVGNILENFESVIEKVIIVINQSPDENATLRWKFTGTATPQFNFINGGKVVWHTIGCPIQRPEEWNKEFARALINAPHVTISDDESQG